MVGKNENPFVQKRVQMLQQDYSTDYYAFSVCLN